MEASLRSSVIIATLQPDEMSEQHLIEAARQDVNSFAVLYQKYFPRIYRYIRMRVKSEEDAADLTQTVFLKALAALPGYQQRTVPFVSWLFTIANHIVTDSYRRHHPTLALEDVTGELFTESEPDTLVIQQEAQQELRALFHTLDPETRNLLALRFAAGLNASEIAVILGKSPAAVRKQLSRTLHSLKEQYHV